MENKIFEKLKSEILRRTKDVNAFESQYKRAYNAECTTELLKVVKDNFHFCCVNGVIDAELIKEFEDVFTAEKIYANVNVSEGYLLVSGNATVSAYNKVYVSASENATVIALDNATVIASGNATVSAHNNVIVSTFDNVTVRAYDNAYATSYRIL